jgi:hypothetical protein
MWRIKPILTLIILALCSGRTTAQGNTFLKYFDAMGVSDIAEDSKNCYLTFIGHKAYRLSPVGEVLWQNSNYWGY